MPSTSGSASIAGVDPASDTPALAKPNSGTIANATHGLQRVFQPVERRIGIVGRAGRSRDGISSAASTPGDGRVDARQQHQQPQQRAPSQIRPQPRARRGG